MWFPDPIGYVKSKIAALFGARAALQDAYGRALIAESRAIDPMLKSEARAVTSKIMQSLQDQNKLESRVRAIAPSSWIPPGLGFIPVIIGGVTVAALATAIYVHLQNTAESMKALSLVEKGIITPAQARDIVTGGGASGLMSNLSTVLMAGAAVYALTLFGPMLRGGKS